MITKRVFIIGSGNSLQEGFDNNLQELLKYKTVFTLNEEFRFFNSTVTFFGDWTFYKCRYDLLKNHPLIIGRFDNKFNNDVPKLPQLILLPSCPKYLGQHDSWKQGFYTGVLTGLFTLTVAIALGFEEIYLLGFDGHAINGKTHHYQGLYGYGMFVNDDGKPRTGMGVKSNGMYNTSVFNKDKKRFNQDFWDKYKPELNRVKIYNVSPTSKIETFPKISYSDLFKKLKNDKECINQSLIRQKIKTYIKTHANFNKNLYYCN